MPRSRPPYPPEYRQELIDLSRQYEPSAQTIRNWLVQADRDEGRRSDGLTSGVREELRKLRRDNRRLREEREVLKKAAAWLLRRPDRSRLGVRVRES